MSWQVLISVSVILYAISVLMQRVLLKNEESDPISFSIFFQVGVSLVIGLLVLAIQGAIKLPHVEGILWSVGLMTLAYAFANIFIFKSLKVTEASRFTVIFTSKTLFAIIASTFIFKEGLTYMQWLGALLIVLGVATVSWQNVSKKINRGDLYAVVAAISFGIANTNDRFLVRYFDPYTYVVIGFFLPAVFIALAYPKKIAGMRLFLRFSNVWKMILLCLIYGLSAVAFFAALQVAPNSSQVFTINSFGAIITVVLSILVLRERSAFAKKIIGVVTSVIGLFLISK